MKPDKTAFDSLIPDRLFISRQRNLVRSSLSVLFLCLIVLSSHLVQAGGFHLTLIGGRRNGMTTLLANPDDLTAIYHNPSGLADLKGIRLELFGSVTFLSTRFEMKSLDPARFPEINPVGCGERGNASCPWPVNATGYYARSIKPKKSFGVLPFLGVSTDLGFIHHQLDDVVFSLASYAPNFYGAWLPEDAPTAYYLTKGLFVLVAVSAGVGWRINKYISVGANISYNYMRLIYAQKLSVVNVQTPEGEEPSFIAIAAQSALGDLLIDYDGVDHGVGWTASVLVSPLDWLSIGIVYAGATAARFKGKLNVKALGPNAPVGEEFDNFINLLGYKLPTGLIVEMPIPPSLMFGLNFKPTRWMEIGLDYRLWFYRVYQRQKITPIYDESKQGKEILTEESLSKIKNYHDSYEIAIGFLFRPVFRYPGLELMTGLAFDESPVPNAHFTLDNPSMNSFKLGMGVRWKITEHWRVSATYMVVFFLERNITTSQTHPPTNVRGSSINHSPGFEVEYRF